MEFRGKEFLNINKLGLFIVTTPTPTPTQHNLNTVVGLDTKMTVHTPPHPPPQKLNIRLWKPQMNIY